jgi:hypothetical protein
MLNDKYKWETSYPLSKNQGRYQQRILKIGDQVTLLADKKDERDIAVVAGCIGRVKYIMCPYPTTSYIFRCDFPHFIVLEFGNQVVRTSYRNIRRFPELRKRNERK